MQAPEPARRHTGACQQFANYKSPAIYELSLSLRFMLYLFGPLGPTPHHCPQEISDIVTILKCFDSESTRGAHMHAKK